MNLNRQIGKYELLNELGAGGMAVVYRARDTTMGRLVALKVMNQKLQGGDRDRKRFLNEARLAGSLNHPNIVTIYELGVDAGFPFIAMEYLEGHDLRHLIEQKRALSLRQKLTIALGVAKALEHAHSRDVIHRDVKPGNIRVLNRADAKLLDFGIAKLTSQDVSRLTNTGAVVGSVAYMSPEQLTGMEVTAASDVFSFGIVLYELLTYRRPFDAESPAGTMWAILHGKEQPLPSDLPDELSQLVRGCLEKSLENRILGFRSVVEDLVRIRRRLPEPHNRKDKKKQNVPPPAVEPTIGVASVETTTTDVHPAEAVTPPGPAGVQTTAHELPHAVYLSAPEPREWPSFGAPVDASDAVTQMTLRGRVRQALALAGLLLAGAGAAMLLNTLVRGGSSDAPANRAEAVNESQPSPMPTASGASVTAPTRPPRRAAGGKGKPTSVAPTRVPAAIVPVDSAAVPAKPEPTTLPTVVESKLAKTTLLSALPPGTSVCLDGKQWKVSTSSASQFEIDMSTGPHGIELMHPEKGVARWPAAAESLGAPARIVVSGSSWTPPMFRVSMKTPSNARSVRWKSTTMNVDGSARPEGKLNQTSGRNIALEGNILDSYVLEFDNQTALTVVFRWAGSEHDRGELLVRSHDGKESVVACRRPASETQCPPQPALACEPMQ